MTIVVRHPGDVLEVPMASEEADGTLVDGFVMLKPGDVDYDAWQDAIKRKLVTVEEPPPDQFPRPTGVDIFQSLTREEQDALVGPETAAGLRSGRIGLGDLARETSPGNSRGYIVPRNGTKAFDPRQPRDEHGRWTDSGGSWVSVPPGGNDAERAAKFFEAPDLSDDDDAREAVEEYMENYAINGLLRRGEPLTQPGMADYASQARALDRVLARSRAKRDVLLYRAVEDWSFPTEGEYTDPGYTSASMDIGATLDFGAGVDAEGTPWGELAVIRVRAGSPALATDLVPSTWGQQEVILPRGSTFRVVGRQQTKFGEAVVLDYEPPGEGTKAGFNPAQARNPLGQWTASGSSASEEERRREQRRKRRQQIALQMTRDAFQGGSLGRRMFDKLLGHKSTAAQRLEFRARLALEKLRGIFGANFVIDGPMTPDLQSLISMFALFPSRVLAELAASGLRIVVSEKEITEQPDFAVFRGTRTPDGRRWEDVPGAYMAERNVIVANARLRDTLLAAHELGHAVDQLHGLSSHPEVLAAQQREHYPPDSFMSDPKEYVAEQVAQYAIEGTKGYARYYDPAVGRVLQSTMGFAG